MTDWVSNLRFFQFLDESHALEQEILAGLKCRPKKVPSKYLYDARGSRLFDKICELPEYYPNRVELGILRGAVSGIAERLGASCLLYEFGSGSGAKSIVLLNSLRNPVAYVPIDISKDSLLNSAESLARRYPDMRIISVCADFHADFAVPDDAYERPKRRVAFFPGSTLGNFEPEEARMFLSKTAMMLGPGGMALIGIDFEKDPEILERAYNDSQGVTREFNLNLLSRLNREFGADIDLEGFEHQAFFNEKEGRVEMHLVSLRSQIYRIADQTLSFEEGETIHTENSYKYRREKFERLVTGTDFSILDAWSDPDWRFGVYLLQVKD